MSDDPHTGDEGWRRRGYWRERGWVGGLILVAVGVILLLQNLGLWIPHNWWAVLLLVPAVAAFMSAARTYRRQGRITSASIAPFAGDLVLVILAVAFLLELELNWDLIGPLALILIGIGILARYVRRA